MNYSGNRNEVLALAEVLKPPNVQILILPSTMLNIHNHVERICYFELLTIYVKIHSFVKVTGMTSNVLAKTRPNLYSRVVAWSMIMLGSMQEVTTLAWLTNVWLLAADCLSERQMIIASKTRPSLHDHVYLTIVCRYYKTITNHVTWSCISFTNHSKRC